MGQQDAPGSSSQRLADGTDAVPVSDFLNIIYKDFDNVSRRPHLLQAFRTFILKHFEEAAILSAEYLRRVDSIVNEFRNRCAHPYKITQDDALNCKTELPKDIDYFIGSWIQ